VDDPLNAVKVWLAVAPLVAYGVWQSGQHVLPNEAPMSGD
jgi:hypothetical protein